MERQKKTICIKKHIKMEKCGRVWGKPEHDYHRKIGTNEEVCARCGDVKE